MDPIRNVKLRWLQGALGDMTYELTRHLSGFVPGKWRPAINAFRCEKELKICVELAGVEKSAIDLTVEPGRVIIRGTRVIPEPPHGSGCARVFALEIDYGPFEREVLLPAEVDVEQSTAEQENGLLWIHLPIKH